jgi:hypothetical protein
MSDYEVEGGAPEVDAGYQAPVDDYQPPPREEYEALQRQLDEQAAYNEWLQSQIPQPEPEPYGYYQPEAYQQFEPQYQPEPQYLDPYTGQPVMEEPDPYAEQLSQMQEQVDFANQMATMYANSVGEATFGNLVGEYEKQIGSLGSDSPEAKQFAYQMVGNIAERYVSQGFQPEQAIWQAVRDQYQYESTLRAKGIESNNQQLTNALKPGAPAANGAASDGNSVPAGDYEEVMKRFLQRQNLPIPS